jgi:hypothetical protein
MSKITEEEMKWRAEDDLRTLTNYAELIKNPERYKKAKELAKKKKNELANLLKMNKEG